jgi:hypothetical protein
MELATSNNIYRMRADFVLRTFDDTFNNKTKGKHQTLFFRCLSSLINQVGPEYFDACADVLFALVYALSPNSESQEPNFWKRPHDPVRALRESKGPVFRRDDVQEAVRMYLDLPVRSSLLDRTLVDILISMEMYAYGDQVFSGWHPVSLKKVLPTVTRLFVGGQLASAFTLGGGLLLYAFLTGTHPSHDMITFAIALWAFNLVVATGALPFSWRQIALENRLKEGPLNAMVQVWQDVEASGPTSAVYVHERCIQAVEKLVGWPPSLFALLDDIISRSGRF